MAKIFGICDNCLHEGWLTEYDGLWLCSACLEEEKLKYKYDQMPTQKQIERCFTEEKQKKLMIYAKLR